MKKMLSIFLVIAACWCAAAGQTTEKYETVYLNNGQVVKGHITEYIPTKSLKIQTDDGRVLSYEMNEVERVVRRSRPEATSYSQGFSDKGAQQGYRAFFDINYTKGCGRFGLNRFGFSTTHGYQFMPFLFAGIGVEYQRYNEEDNSKLRTFTTYADLRSEFLKSNFTPYVELRAGYTFKKNMGFFFNPQVGFRFGLSKAQPRLALNVSLGYEYQRVHAYMLNTLDASNLVVLHEVSSMSHYLLDDYSSQNCGGITMRLGVEF